MDNQEEIRLRLVRPDTSTRTELPVATSGVSAGFPSPADDHLDPPLDLNRELVRNPGATFFARVAGDSMDFWAGRLSDRGLTAGGITTLDGRASLDFQDPEGQRFRLTEDAPGVVANPWAKSPVPAQHQIHGLGPITISVPDLAPTDIVLTRVMNMRKAREYASPDGHGSVHVYEMGAGGPAAELHVAVQPDLPVARQGAGAVHHVAFRVPDVPTIHQWAQRLDELRIPSSGEVERFYFRSLYFREPGGNLFEIATDGPGFAVDEPLETLGESLSLPPFLERQRDQIEARLKPLD